MADGGNVELVEIDGLVVKLKLKGACGSCPSSLTTMTMGIKRRLLERIPVRGVSVRARTCVCVCACVRRRCCVCIARVVHMCCMRVARLCVCGLPLPSMRGRRARACSGLHLPKPRPAALRSKLTRRPSSPFPPASCLPPLLRPSTLASHHRK